MKKKATLLITNLYKVYTGKEINHRMIVLHNAYIGVFHDEIIAIGVGDYSELIDKDTRVIDARGHIAIPGWIDCALQLPVTKGNAHRQYHETCMNAMRHGVTSIHVSSPKPEAFYEHYAYEVFWQITISQRYPLVDAKAILTQNKAYKRCCFVSNPGSPDPLKSAQLFYQKYQPSSMQVLKGLCVYPALALHLSDRGVLEKGKKADIVLCNALDLQEVFATLRDDLIFQVIRHGVRIFPNVII